LAAGRAAAGMADAGGRTVSSAGSLIVCTGSPGYFAILGGLRDEIMQKFFEKYSWRIPGNWEK
ncbi:hypothetical protein, partial [Burkholderia sp. SIMBA_052]|uniref:hypothetical protein n=1 Tax=Burkholderia sp. SIMBA_052 TaxID=3085793 RepID=UPI00397AFDCB